MAYNNGFPVTFPQMFAPQFQPPAPQTMTPPTIHADIIQIAGEQEAWNYPVGQIMMARDDSAIFIKTSGPNGTPELEVYERRTKRVPEAASAYVTKEELAEALKALQGSKEAVK